MPVTGSEQILATFIFEELLRNIPADSDERVQENLRQFSEAIARAVVRWLTSIGTASVEITIPPLSVIVPPGGGTGSTVPITIPGNIK